MHHKLSYMGVINLTPNSFSDGGRYQDPHDVLKQFLSLSSWAQVIDIGGESTAPMNAPITAEIERQRFSEYFLDHLHELPTYKGYISIDTYRAETFIYVSERILGIWPAAKIIWNDISGKLDTDWEWAIKNATFDFEYIFCHNLAPSRIDSGLHKKYERNELNILAHLTCYFLEGMQKLEAYEVKKFWIDPCFGFSKTKEQNIELHHHFASWCNNFPYDKFIYASSRKSFWRLTTDESNESLDLKHKIFLGEMKKYFQKTLLCRVHSQSQIGFIYK